MIVYFIVGMIVATIVLTIGIVIGYSLSRGNVSKPKVLKFKPFKDNKLLDPVEPGREDEWPLNKK